MPASPATKAPPLRELELEGGYTVGKISNNYAPAITGNGLSYVASGAYRFGSWALKVDDRSDQFNDTATTAKGVGFTAPDGTYEIIPPFTGRVTSIDERVEHSAITKNAYIGLSYLTTSTTYGAPAVHGLGIGIEQYCGFRAFELCGFVYYYPRLSGTFLQTDPASPNDGKSFAVHNGGLKLDFESSLPLSRNFYFYFGYNGYVFLQSGTAATETERVTGPFIGVGTRLLREGPAAAEPDTTKLVQTTATYPGYVQGAIGFWGANTGGGNNSPGTDQVGATYLPGKFAFDANLHSFNYPQTNGLPNTTPSGSINDAFIQENALVSVTQHQLYLGVGAMQKSATAGYSSQTGWGLGGAKLPNLSARFSNFASLFYYTTAPAQYVGSGTKISEDRRYLVYDYGLTYRPAGRAYVYAGYWGYHGNFGNAPIDEVHADVYTGIGYRL